MISRNQPITFADLKALADLANGKLNPPTPFTFTSFAGDDKIGLAQSITPVSTNGGQFNYKVSFWLFSYKTISGIKTYSWEPAVKAFQPTQAVKMQWTWQDADTNPADGYVVVILAPGTNFAKPSWIYWWQDIGAVHTFSEDGSFSDPKWNWDNTLIQNYNQGVQGFADLICGHGIWLKQLNTLREAILTHTDILCSNTGSINGLYNILESGYGNVVAEGLEGLQSGPWNVAVGPTLTAYLERLKNFIPLSYAARETGFTQCFRNIKFYFRNADAPGGVNITAQNQLLNWEIYSDPQTLTHSHWPIILTSCSTGHIKIQQSGGGTVYHDIDVVAGTIYDLSIDVTVSGIPPDSFTPGFQQALDIDVTFTTPAATVSAPAQGIELNNDILVVSVPDNYFQIQFNVGYGNNPQPFAGTQLMTSCGKLVLTENNNTIGIWSAMTMPAAGEMVYLDQDLPQYQQFLGDTNNGSSRRVERLAKYNQANTAGYMPVVDNRGALWPVFSIDDFEPDDVLGEALNGSFAWQKSIATKKVELLTTPQVIPMNPAALSGNEFVLNAGLERLRVAVVDPNVIVYGKQGQPPTLADSDIQFPGGAWQEITLTPNQDWYFAFLNTTVPVINTTFYAVLYFQADAPNGTFFSSQLDDGNNTIPNNEGYSYHLSDAGVNFNPNPVPFLGYCVTSITVRRQPNSQTGIAPSAGTADLDCDIGIMEGYGFDAQGTFSKFITATIPAGQASVTVPVFWPALSGTPLAYDCDEVVSVRAEVNFQPQIFSQWNPVYAQVAGQEFAIGYFNGPPWWGTATNDPPPLTASLFMLDGFIGAPIILPLSNALYNDLETLLNAM